MSFEARLRRTNLFGCVLTIAVCSFAGCGGASDEPVGYHLSGNATFDGKPIPAGKILFIPDSSKGNQGVAGFAEIKDGKYDTALPGGKQHASGAMIVKIEGFDAAAQADDSSGEVTTKALFPTYEEPAELPKEDTTKDFNVPASAAEQTPPKSSDV